MIHSFSKDAFFGENPKTDLWPQIVWIPHQQKQKQKQNKKNKRKQTKIRERIILLWQDGLEARNIYIIQNDISLVLP